MIDTPHFLILLMILIPFIFIVFFVFAITRTVSLVIWDGYKIENTTTLLRELCAGLWRWWGAKGLTHEITNAICMWHAAKKEARRKRLYDWERGTQECWGDREGTRRYKMKWIASGRGVWHVPTSNDDPEGHWIE